MYEYVWIIKQSDKTKEHANSQSQNTSGIPFLYLSQSIVF